MNEFADFMGGKKVPVVRCSNCEGEFSYVSPQVQCPWCHTVAGDEPFVVAFGPTTPPPSEDPQ